MESNKQHGPNPTDKYPIKGNNILQFIKNTITRPNIIAGEYSYYDAKNGESFEDQGFCCKVTQNIENLGLHR